MPYSMLLRISYFTVLKLHMQKFRASAKLVWVCQQSTNKLVKSAQFVHFLLDSVQNLLTTTVYSCFAMRLIRSVR